MTAAPQSAQLPPQAQQLLEQMHGIFAPEPVGWWPPAPGWWILAALVFTVLFSLVVAIRRHRRNTAYKRSALPLVNALQNYDDATLPTEANRLLKRIALVAYPEQRTAINQLYGDSWVQWLNERCKNPVFSGPVADALARGGYERGLPSPREQITQDIQHWIRRHRRTASRPPNGRLQHV